MRMSTRRRSTTPRGWNSWSYSAARAARAAGSSPEAASFLASMPVLRAFLREMALPGSVRGPVESCALERLARICFWVATGPPATTVAGERGRFRGVGRQVIEGKRRKKKCSSDGERSPRCPDTPFRAEKHSGPSTPAELLRQAHPPHEILESRFGSNPVEPLVRENPAVHGPFRVRLLEPLQCPLPLPEAFINHGDVLGRNVPSLRQPLHLLQHLLPLGPSARDAQRVPQIHQLQ